MNIIEERTIALAGVLQACQQVQSLARTGVADTAVYTSAMQSVLVLDAMSTPAVFGGLGGVRAGLKLIEQGIFNSPEMSDLEVLRYMMSILQLQKQLYTDQQKFSQFGQAIDRLSSFSEDDLANAFSEVYQTHISVLRPQIIVQGEQEHLQQNGVPEQVRTMLLAAVRSAVLWQQKGGGKFRLVWERTRMRQAAKSLLAQH
ncbi:MAG: high frequency lysogenization protein [Arenicella sp.]|jgi:high frequency lysogenization protein